MESITFKLSATDVAKAVTQYAESVASGKVTKVTPKRGGAVEVTLETTKNGLDVAADLMRR